MNEHATRAWERARLAGDAATDAEAFALFYEAMHALRESIAAGEKGLDQQYAIAAAKYACKRRFERAAGSDATVIAESKADGWRLTQKPAPAWIDAAAAHDFNDESSP